MAGAKIGRKNAFVMKKSEIFALVLDSVSVVTELSEEDILSKSRREDIAQARMLLVHFCRVMGLYTSQIAGLAGMSHRQTNRLAARANERLSACSSSDTQTCIYARAIGTELGHKRGAIKS